METRATYATQTQTTSYFMSLEDVYADLAGAVVTRFDTSNYEVERLPPGPFQFSDLLQLLNNQLCELSSISFFLKP